ncbi:MAG: c-type cytochrome [Lysobacter sp.]
MPFVTRKSLIILTVLSSVAVAAVGGFIWSGVYNVGADDQHTRPVYALMRTLRERSIESRTRKLHVPDLADPARIVQGAGNYNAMCMGCHLAPGMPATELSKGLYPAPPDLTKTTVDAAEAFWVIKHGIKASGMPAWGKSMQDEYIWNMAAFVQELPKLSPTQYDTLVANSGGHSHGGGETKPHGHTEGTPVDQRASGADDHGTGLAGKQTEETTKDGVMHTHADGTRERHPAPTTTKSPMKPATKSTPTAEAEPRAGTSMPEPKPAEHADDGHHDH